MRIVVIEDDERIASFVARGLGAQGHQVLTAGNGSDGITLATEPDVELVILDLSLPDLDGTQVLARLRGSKGLPPVLVLTARDSIADKVDVLDHGADDYMTKPFSLDELLARVRVLGRRADQPAAARLERGGLVLDLAARRATREGHSIELSTREFSLLAYLMRHAGQVLSRVQILAAVWDYDFDPRSNVVDVYIRYLRNKVDVPGQPSLIETVRGSGYRFRSDASAA
jgi:DNA-binding response OmpR family regulator